MIPSLPFAPWHLWGTSQTISTRVLSTGFVDRPSNQLAKINYGRPETWTFLFGVQFDVVPNSVGIVDVFVDFDLIIGLGRSSIVLPPVRANVAVPTPGFARFLTNYSGGGDQLSGSALWSSVVEAPAMTPFIPVGNPVRLDKFPAQDIQCSGRLAATCPGGDPAENATLSATLHSYFAPSTHIRPEWFIDEPGNEPRFRGAEHGGT